MVKEQRFVLVVIGRLGVEVVQPESVDNGLLLAIRLTAVLSITVVVSVVVVHSVVEVVGVCQLLVSEIHILRFD
jgi:hypothetical protein